MRRYALAFAALTAYIALSLLLSTTAAQNGVRINGVTAVAGPTGATGDTGATGAAGGPTVWSSGASYTSGNLVIDRGGIWQAVNSNSNSEPISGNAHWTLIGGEPYVDYLITPAMFAAAPFYDPTASGPGVTLIPAPGANLMVQPLRVWSLTSEGDPWEFNVGPQLAWGSPAGPSVFDNWSSFSYLLTNWLPDVSPGTFSTYASFTPRANNVVALANSGYVNEPIIVWNDTDPSNGGSTIGSRSLWARIYYTIAPMNTSTAVFPTTYYTITAVNQGLKKFTVSDSGAALDGVTGSFVVTGSTGNNGTYTIVSAVAGAGSTVVTVSEAVPDATADGWGNQ